MYSARSLHATTTLMAVIVSVGVGVSGLRGAGVGGGLAYTIISLGDRVRMYISLARLGRGRGGYGRAALGLS